MPFFTAALEGPISLADDTLHLEAVPEAQLR